MKAKNFAIGEMILLLSCAWALTGCRTILLDDKFDKKESQEKEKIKQEQQEQEEQKEQKGEIWV